MLGTLVFWDVLLPGLSQQHFSMEANQGAVLHTKSSLRVLEAPSTGSPIPCPILPRGRHKVQSVQSDSWCGLRIVNNVLSGMLCG